MKKATTKKQKYEFEYCCKTDIGKKEIEMMILSGIIFLKMKKSEKLLDLCLL